MVEQKFEIFYIGLKPGITEQLAVQGLAQLLNVEDDAAVKIIQNTLTVLSSGLTKVKAEQYLNAFSKIGLDVELRACSVQKNGFSDRPPLAETSQSFSQSTSTGDTNAPVEFKGEGFEYFKIWIVNIFLTIITLGIYSAWAKVRNKQYFYGNTFIDGSSFRYTAKPIAILKGRLIALAFFAAYSLLNKFNPILGGVLFIILMTFIPWIIVRSLQFNARNSVYRNIRFNFDAKAKDAAMVFLVWPILIPFTLGLIMPFIWYKQSQFFVNHSAFGTSNFEFSAGAKDYYKVFLNIFLAVIGFGIVFAVIAKVIGVPNSPELQQLFVLIGSPFMMLMYLFIFAYSATALGNLFFNASTINAHGFTATLQIPKMAWLYFSNTLGIVLTLGLFIPWAQIRIARYRSESLTLNMSGSMDSFVNAEQEHVSALGEQVGEVFDMDVSIL